MKLKKMTLSWLTVTHLCNLRCQWCYQRELGGRGKIMSKELAKELVDLLAKMGIETVVLIGGEPTLYNHFFTLIKYIKTKGMRVTVVTNALAFANHKFLDKAVRAGVDSITTSVKGSSRKEYEESTGRPGGYDIVCQAIKNIQKTQTKQMISITISHSIIQNWNGMIRFMKDYGATFFSLSFEKPSILSRGEFTFDERMMSNKIAPFVQEVMYPSLVETGLDFKMEFVCPQCHFPQEFINKAEAENHVFGGCLLLKSRGLVFDPQGFVLPCNHFVGYPLGQYGVDFRTAGEFSKWQETNKIKEFYETTRKAPCEKCAECDRWNKCGAGCRLWWFYRGSQELLNNCPIKGVVI